MTQSLLHPRILVICSIVLITIFTLYLFAYNSIILTKLTSDRVKADPDLVSWKELANLQESHSWILDKLRNLHPDISADLPPPKSSNLDPSSSTPSNVLFHPDGYIIGNPLLHPECANAITSQIPGHLNEYFPHLLTEIHDHWFVSRESYSALFSHSHDVEHYKVHQKRKNKQYHMATKVQSSKRKGFNNSETTSYFNIEKSASSTSTTYLKRQADIDEEFAFEQHVVDSGQLVTSNCTFTFVRDPLQRFVSAYYTVNRLMWDVEHHPDRIQDHQHIADLKHVFKFLTIEGEPERFRAFVDDLSIFESVFIFGSRHLQHMMSQSAILSVADISHIGRNLEWFTHPESGQNDDRFFIGKVEQYEEHWTKLTEICDDIIMYEKEIQLMPSYGARESLNKTYLEVMSLGDWKKGDVLPAYNAVDEITFAKIVNFYYQDYVCFGYQPKLPDFINTTKSESE